MAINLLVETRVENEATFRQQNPTLFAGEIALTKELTDVRIGDGEKKWAELTPLNLPITVKEKWLKLVQSSTRSHLVTLPDINYAYSVVNVDSNSMLENVVKTIIEGNNYFDVYEEKTSIIDNCGTLTLQSSGSQNLLFQTIADSEKCQNISALKLKTLKEEERVYYFWDVNSHKKIAENLKKINDSTTKIENIQTMLNNPLTGLEALNNKVSLFATGADGIVRGPTSEENYDNYFLNAKNNWVRVALTAEEIKMSSSANVTVAQKINSLENEINKGSNLSIGTIGDANTENYVVTVRGTSDTAIRYTNSVKIQNGVLFGAAWNDYAEARQTNGVSAGRVVVENGDDTLSISTERLMLGGNIVSDTYGMLIGETDKAKTPIALCGRVLAYPFEDKEEYYPGAPVCTGPDGTVSLMSKDEVLHYPECIIGYVSAIPNYEEWNGKKVKGRIWIKVV